VIATPKMPPSHAFADIVEGAHFTYDYELTSDVYKKFLEAFSDTNPLHVDPEYAKALGFPAPVAHGGILNGFLSHFVGMHFPGKTAMLLSTDLYFLKPNFVGDSLTFRVVVAQKMESHKVLVLQLVVENNTRKMTTAKGKIQVKMAESTRG
jgi:acyl dehydratase